MKYALIKFLAYLILVVSIIFGAGFLVLMVFIYFKIPQANIVRLIVLESGILILGAVVFLAGFAIYRSLISLLEVKEEVKTLTEEIDKLEKNNTG